MDDNKNLSVKRASHDLDSSSTSSALHNHDLSNTTEDISSSTTRTTDAAKSVIHEVETMPMGTTAGRAMKKPKITATATANIPPASTSSNTSNNNNIFDVTETLGLKEGSRIEVRWELNFDNNNDNDDVDIDISKNTDDKTADKSQTEATTITAFASGTCTSPITNTTETKWWGGTLLKADGRTHTLKHGNDEVVVPIHSIDYDPYPPSFPDRSIEDVCFLSNRSLLLFIQQEAGGGGSTSSGHSSRTSCWRKEGDSWEPSSKELEDVGAGCDDLSDDDDNNAIIDNHNHDNNNDNDHDDDEISVASTSQEDGLREVLDTILKSALESSGVMAKMQMMERSQQAIMAEKIASTKEKLIVKFLDKLRHEEIDEGDGDACARQQQKGREPVITPELVQNVMAELGNELRR